MHEVQSGPEYWQGTIVLLIGCYIREVKVVIHVKSGKRIGDSLPMRCAQIAAH